MKPELVPITIGSLPPTGPMVNTCTKVTIPAMSIAFCRSATCKSPPGSIPQAAVIIRRGVRFPTNMASTCCRPSGIASFKGGLPSRSYGVAVFSLVSPFISLSFVNVNVYIARPSVYQ